MKPILAAILMLLFQGFGSAGEHQLSKEQVTKIAHLVIAQAKYRGFVDVYDQTLRENAKYDAKEKIWVIPNVSAPGVSGNPPFFEIRDADGFYRIGWGPRRDKTSFTMSTQIKKQIQNIIADGRKPDQ